MMDKNEKDPGPIESLNVTVEEVSPFHPQSKRVERVFRAVHERFDQQFSTNTSGSSSTPQDRTGVYFDNGKDFKKPAEILVSDHMIHDTEVVNDLEEQSEDDKQN